MRYTAILTAVFLFASSPGFAQDTRTDTVKVPVGNIRKEPDTGAPIVCRVRRGDALTIYRKEGKWFFVGLPNGGSGWAHRILFKRPQIEDSQQSGVPIAETMPVREITSIRTVVFSDTEAKVLFTLSGYFPPKTSTVSGQRPHVVCEFIGAVPAAGISGTIPGDGKFIRRIAVEADDRGTRVSVLLSPEHNYTIEQVFFEKEKVYSLVFIKM